MWPSTCLSKFLAIYQSVYQTIHQSSNLSVQLSASLGGRLDCFAIYFAVMKTRDRLQEVFKLAETRPSSCSPSPPCSTWRKSADWRNPLGYGLTCVINEKLLTYDTRFPLEVINHSTYKSIACSKKPFITERWERCLSWCSSKKVMMSRGKFSF